MRRPRWGLLCWRERVLRKGTGTFLRRRSRQEKAAIRASFLLRKGTGTFLRREMPIGEGGLSNSFSRFHDRDLRIRCHSGGALIRMPVTTLHSLEGSLIRGLVMSLCSSGVFAKHRPSAHSWQQASEVLGPREKRPLRVVAASFSVGWGLLLGLAGRKCYRDEFCARIPAGQSAPPRKADGKDAPGARLPGGKRGFAALPGGFLAKSSLRAEN